MAKNPLPDCAQAGPPGDGHRHGQVTNRSQTYNPQNDRWTKRGTDSGKFIDQKNEKDSPFKWVRKEKKN